MKEIVERHGGRVYAESDGPGKGSRFVVELPLVPSPGVRAPESGTPVVLPRSIGVLLVEDNPDTRALVADTLSLAGYEVQTAGSGEDALKLLHEQTACFPSRGCRARCGHASPAPPRHYPVRHRAPRHGWLRVPSPGTRRRTWPRCRPCGDRLGSGRMCAADRVRVCLPLREAVDIHALDAASGSG